MASETYEKARKAMDSKDFVKPVVVEFMDVSTAHITKEDSEKLDAGAADYNLSYDKFNYGYYVYVPSISSTDALPFSSAFKTLLHYARESGFSYIKLDCDGTSYPQLETFDW